jgi:hypothetical protein
MLATTKKTNIRNDSLTIIRYLRTATVENRRTAEFTVLVYHQSLDIWALQVLLAQPK